MNRQTIQEIREQKPWMAICYDFDKTLSPDEMRAFALIPSFGMKSLNFGRNLTHWQKRTAWTTIWHGCTSRSNIRK